VQQSEIIHFLFLLSRYTHVVAASLLLGGTLFYELIVPVAIDEMKDEQKLWIFARARWAFRWLVWLCSAALLLSGIATTYRNWYAYTGAEAAAMDPLLFYTSHHTNQLQASGPTIWWAAHGILSLVGIIIALALVTGRTPPRYPLLWMRVNLVILLVAFFLASTARHLRLRQIETHLPPTLPISSE
jgi:hypothetical protein